MRTPLVSMAESSSKGLRATLIDEDGDVISIVVFVSDTGEAVAFPVAEGEDAPPSDHDDGPSVNDPVPLGAPPSVEVAPPAPAGSRHAGLPPPIKRKRRKKARRTVVIDGVFRAADQD